MTTATVIPFPTRRPAPSPETATTDQPRRGAPAHVLALWAVEAASGA